MGVVNVGDGYDDGRGDKLRDAFSKINGKFTQIDVDIANIPAGPEGPKGDPGDKGDQGIDGYTPYIDNVTGMWYINGISTGVQAQGPKGDEGISPHIDPTTGNWFVGTVDTGIKAQGDKGDKGDQGDPGVDGHKMEVLTQAEYDASNKDPDTLYFIKA